MAVTAISLCSFHFYLWLEHSDISLVNLHLHIGVLELLYLIEVASDLPQHECLGLSRVDGVLEAVQLLVRRHCLVDAEVVPGNVGDIKLVRTFRFLVSLLVQTFRVLVILLARNFRYL